MEIQDEMQIRIIQTLDLIGRADTSIKRHRQREDTDITAIANYEELKARFTSELLELLEKVGVNFKLSVAA
jgi:hypothetical protein